MLRRALILLLGFWLGLVASALPSPAQSPPSGNTLTGPTFGSPPAQSTGAEGNYFFDITTGLVFGPKTAGVWPPTAAQPSAVPAPALTTTQTYPIFSNALVGATAVAPTQNTARCAPFLWPWTSHVDKASMTVTTLGTGPLNFALYSDAIDSTTHIHQPQTLLTDPSLTFTVTSAATVSVTLGTPGIGIPLPKGLNWACINDTTAADLVRYAGLNGNSTTIMGLVGSTSLAGVTGTTPNIAYTFAITAGTTTTNWPSFTGQTFNQGGASIPSFGLEVVSAP